MTEWLALVVAVPLAAAAVTAPLGLRPQRVVALGAHLLALALTGTVLARVAGGDLLVSRLGGWHARIAVPLVADPLAGLLVALAALMVLVCAWFAVVSGADERPGFHPLVLVLSAGVYGAFLTGDLFTLFVFVEVMLVPSYILLAMGGDRPASAAYVTVNLLASTVLVSGVGLVYATAGTTNLAALAGAARESGESAMAAGVVVFALAGKAAVVPLHLWLPRTYPVAPPVVTALFSGLLTKVGVYGLYRMYAVVFDGDPRYRWLVLGVAVVTMVVGVAEAVGQNAMRRILASHMVSQVGYLVIGLGVFTAVGVTAAVFYLVQYVLVKGALFLVAGAVERVHGTDALDRLGGLSRASPLLAAAFLGAALSLAGIPPFSGFVGKLLLVFAAFDDVVWWVGGVAVAVSLGTLLSMVKIWNGVFWGAPVPVAAAGRAGDEPEAPEAPPRIPVRLVLPAVALTVLSLLLGLGADGLLTLSARAANGLLAPERYVEAVLTR